MLKSASVTGKESKHFHLISSSPVRQQNAKAHSFPEPPVALGSALRRTCCRHPSPAALGREALSAALGERSPGPGPVSQAESRGSAPAPGRRGRLDAAGTAPAGSGAGCCRCVVFGCRESAPHAEVRWLALKVTAF